jgi:hypothetical protein
LATLMPLVIGHATLCSIVPSDIAVHKEAPARIFAAVIICSLSSNSCILVFREQLTFTDM